MILDYKSEIYTIKNGLTNTDKYYYQEFMFLSEVNYIKDMEYVSVRNISNTNPLSYTFLVRNGTAGKSSELYKFTSGLSAQP